MKEYDNRDDIIDAMERLEDFHKLLEDRRRVYGDGGRLKGWCLLNGALSLDPMGGLGRGKKIEDFHERVIEYEELRRFLEIRDGEEPYLSYTYGGSSLAIPRPGMVCPVCLKEWTVYDIPKCYHH